MEAHEQKEIKESENIIKLQTKRTDLSKYRFIEEIKSDLGREIDRDLGIDRTPKKSGFKGFMQKIIKMF